MEQLYTTREVAEKLRLTESGVRLLCKRYKRGEVGGLPHVRIGGAFRFTAEDVAVFLRAKRRPNG